LKQLPRDNVRFLSQSRPARARGLKQKVFEQYKKLAGVAPRAGAWIETQSPALQSWPTDVAPRAGAWIETSSGIGTVSIGKVAPRAGAWIETFSILKFFPPWKSRAPRGRVD